MSWLISTGFLAPCLVILILVVIVMFCVDVESNWERPKWFKYTYIFSAEFKRRESLRNRVETNLSKR